MASAVNSPSFIKQVGTPRERSRRVITRDSNPEKRRTVPGPSPEHKLSNLLGSSSTVRHKASQKEELTTTLNELITFLAIGVLVRCCLIRTLLEQHRPVFAVLQTQIGEFASSAPSPRSPTIGSKQLKQNSASAERSSEDLEMIQLARL